MFHLPVVLEKRHVVGGGLDAKYLAEFVIHLDGGIAKAMFDACALDPGRELRAEFLRQLRGERPERGGGAEHQIGGIFNLHQTPVIGLTEHVEYWAALLGGCRIPFGRQQDSTVAPGLSTARHRNL
jgi:hypothetical protein